MMMDGTALDTKKWIVIYPVYINSKKMVADGRRIGAEKACENPTCIEINDCCSHLKIPCAVEITAFVSSPQKLSNRIIHIFHLLDKAYPRDFMQRGRVRVLLRRGDGSPYNPAIASKKQLLLRVAELVPKHPGRTKKQEASNTSTAAPSKLGRGGKKKR